MPSSKRTVLTPAGVLLGGALVLAFASVPAHAEDASALLPLETVAATQAHDWQPDGSSLSESAAPNTGEELSNQEELSDQTAAEIAPKSEIAGEPLVSELPAPIGEPETRAFLQKRAPRRAAPKAVAPRASAANAARAWQSVERATKLLTANNAAAALGHYQTAVRLDPNNAYALNGVADSLYSLGRNAEAERAYRRALARTPGNVKLQKGLAGSLVAQQKYPEATNLLKRVANASPRDFETMYQLAQVLTWTQRYREADPYYRRALELQPNNAQAWTAWGESLSFAKDSRARNAFMGALRSRPNDTRTQIGLGNLYLWNAEYPDAERTFKNVLAREPRNLTALIGVGDALSFTNAQAEAIPYYQRALAIAPQNSSAQIGLGRALIQTRREKEGLPYIQRVLEREPRNPIALELLADAQSASTPATASALATLQRLLAMQTDPQEQAETWLRIAQLQNRTGDWENAETSYRKAIELAPRDAEISLAYAQALIDEDNAADARNVVEDILRADPGNVRALTMQVVVESKTGSPERAASLANRLLALDLSTPEDALVLANALRTTGNTEAAKKVLERLATQNSDDPAIALQVATATRDAGLYDLATPIFQDLLKSQPTNREARYKYAEMLLWQNQFDAAASEVALLLKDEDDLEARVLSATIALRRDEASGLPIAEREAEAILAADSRNVDALVLRTQTLSLRQRYAEAVTAAKAAVDAEPNNLEARLALARNLYYARQTPEAIGEYRELIKRAPADVSVKLELAKIYLDQNQLSDAEAIYRDILMANGSILPPVARIEGAIRRSYARVSPSLKPLRGEKFYNASQQGKRGFRRVSGIAAPTVPTAPGTTTSPVPAAPTAPTASDTDAAPSAPDATAPNTGISTPPVPDATAATPADVPTAPSTPATPAPAPTPTDGVTTVAPDTIDTVPVAATAAEAIAANVGLGEVRRRQGRFDEAIEFFNAALERDSANAEARLGLAQSLRGKTEYLRALAEVERVLATDEANLDARVLRAQLLADTGQNAQAQTELNALVTGLPAEPTLETYLDLSSAFVELENYDAALQLLSAAAEDYPDRIEVTTRQGETYTFARRWDDALAVWDRLLAIDASDTTAVLGKARVYNYSTRLTDAESNYRRVLELEPTNYSALTELADVLARQSEYPDSIALYRQAIEQNPEDLKIRVELARVMRYNRQFTEAEAVLNDVIATDARYAPAYTERSLARSGQGTYESAIADARQALEITPGDVNAQLGLAEVLSYAEQYDESIRLYQAALERDPQNEKARVELGAALSYSGRYDDALAQLDAVLRDNPQNPDAQIMRADTLARAGRTPQAIAAYNAILGTDSRNVRARIGLAEAYSYGGQYDNSLRVYDQLIADDSENVAYRVARGRTLGFARRYPQAVSLLRPIVAAHPDNIPARLAFAEVLTNSGNPNWRREAVTQYQTILSADAQNIDARVGLGRVYSYSSQYKAAERELNTVLSRYPDNRDARLALAETQRFSGRPFDARDNYERVLAADATNAGARAGLLSVRRDISPSITPAVRNFSDSNNVRLRSYSLGATLPTRAGTIGIIGETGRYEDSDDDVSRRRRAVSLLLARQFGALQARLLLSRVNYSDAPSKTLYDLLVERRYTPRKRWFANIRKLDVIESGGAIEEGITDRQLRVGGEYPLARRFDLAVELIRHSYSDGNSRTSLSPSLYYRVVDGQPQGRPTLRVGVGYQYDNSSTFSPLYYTPQSYNSFALLADYVKDQGRLRYGLFAAVPLTGSGEDGDDGAENRPSNTLFGFVNYDLSEAIELFINAGIVRGPNYDSNEITAGATVRFR